MERMQLEQAYQSLVARHTSLSDSKPDGGQERRKYPRFRVHTTDLWISDVPEFAVRDVSVSGIGLAADFPLAAGERVRVGLRDDEAVEAEVLRCELVDSGSQYWAPLFHISCRFLDELAGKAIVVLTKMREQEMLAQALA